MILILSGRYINDEMAAELGKIPPSFLPVGNKRLFEHQLDMLKGLEQEIALSVPVDFELSSYDLKLLKDSGVKLIKSDTNLSLGESILLLLGGSEVGEDLSILFGDTLFSRLNLNRDTFSVGVHDEFYPWGVAQKEGNGFKFINGVETTEADAYVLSGWFNFSDSNMLNDCLKRSGGDFFEAITDYDNVMHLKPLIMDGWLDFGHLHTYFHSKAKKTTERAFNSLEITGRKVIKKSSKNEKILAEAKFESIPGDLKIYTPIFLWKKQEKEEVSYATEYLYLSTLSELFVYGRLPIKVWRRIFNSSADFIEVAAGVDPGYDLTKDVESLFIDKNLSRLKAINLDGRFDVKNAVKLNGRSYLSLVELVNLLIQEIKISDKYFGCIHGDFCFSNIMYDFRTNSIKLIDPRGIVHDGRASIFGDVRYDLAKYYHSIVGFYDLIVAGRYTLIEEGVNAFKFDISCDEDQLSIRDAFLESKVANKYGRREVYILMILLFISMIPLHTEDENRQLALLLNAYRLYGSLPKEVK